MKWFNDSYEHFRSIGCSPDAVEAGVMLAFGYTLDSSPGPWFYQDTVLGWRMVSESERQMMSLPDLKTWIFYGTFVVNCRQYLPWLMPQFTDKAKQNKFIVSHCLPVLCVFIDFNSECHNDDIMHVYDL